MVSLLKFLKEKRWALVAILVGVFWGFGSAILCIAFNLVIFGFNIMYIVSPLLAGFVETFIARRRYGKSTGAISALFTFILINGYGWFAPGNIFPKEPVRLSLITIIAIVLTLQAAFPTLINYILFVVGVGTIRKFIEFLLFIPSRIRRKPIQAKKNEDMLGPSADELFIEELAVPILSVPPIKGGKIIKYVGLVAGEAVAKEKEAENRVSKLTKIIEPPLLDEIYLGDARENALSQMLDEAKSLGATTVIDVIMDYVSMGGLQGSALLVTVSGTAVIMENDAQELEKKSSKNSKSMSNNEINTFKANISTNKEDSVSRVIKKISGSGGNTEEVNKKLITSNKNVSPIIDKIRASSQIIGKEVIDSSATVIGKVKDLEIDLDNNQIEAIVLSTGGTTDSLRISKEEIIIPYNTVVQIGDKILIKEINTDIRDINDYYSYFENKIRNIKI